MKTTKSLSLAQRKPELKLQAIDQFLTGIAPAPPRAAPSPGETYRQSLERRATVPLALESPWARGGLNE